MTSEPSLSNSAAHYRAMAEKAAEDLVGTCRAIYDLGEEYEDASNEQVFCLRLDELVFECQKCNWWYSQDENHEDPETGQWICEECFNED